jgi:AraC-like DNA-binding protein
MIYLEQPPAPHLRPWVRSLWYCRAPQISQHRERVLPNGCMQIIVNLARDFLTDCPEDGAVSRRHPQAIIVGARARYEVIDTADMEDLAGIVIQPGAFARMFGERADLFFEKSIRLEEVWVGARIATRLQEVHTPVDRLKKLEFLLSGLLGHGIQRPALVDQAISLFREKSLSVRDCARSAGVSERRLSQVFQEHVGIAPKTWCRIRRFQTAARALHKGVAVPWAELALACGYYDQPHFANDFRAFSGIDPTTYTKHRGLWQNHVPIP